MFVSFRRICDLRETARREVLPFVVLFGCIAAYLWRPSVSPDHFWGVRRFVPIVIPGLLFYGAIGFQAIREHMRPQRWHVAASIVLAAYCLVFLGRGNSILTAGREQRGLYDQVAAFAGQLPEGLILMEDNADLNVALWLGFGKAAVPVSLREPQQQEALLDLQRVAGSTRLPVHIIGGKALGFAGLATAKPVVSRFDWTEIAPTLTPLADRWQAAHRDYYLHRVDDVAAKTMPALWGNERNWQAAESGFHNEDVATEEIGRWTDGDATIAIPLTSFAPVPEALVVRLHAREPNGAQLVIDANGLTIFDAHVPGGESALRVPLPSALRGANVLTLRFISDTFTPADTDSSGDRRRLGIFLRGVETQRPDDSKSPRANADLNARLVLLRRPALQLTGGKPSEAILVRVTNSGNAIWNREPAESRSAIALGILWRRSGDPAQRVSERRVALPANVRPGEFVTLPVVLQPSDDAGKPLPPGNYLVTIDMVAEQQAWFGEVGSEPLKLAIQIVQ